MVSLAEVINLERPTESFLCPLEANVFNIDFVAFKIRSLDGNNPGVIFEIKKDPTAVEPQQPPATIEEADSSRMIRYHFGPAFLEFKNIGTELEFSVGDRPLRNFRMIERHYFRDRIIKSFDFTMPFCIPNTVNTWEIIYSMPDLDPMLKMDIIANPWEVRSDSFYFVEDLLVMHNKAEYNYSP